MKDEVDDLHERVTRAKLALTLQQKQQGSEQASTPLDTQAQKDLEQLITLHQNAALELAAMSDASSKTRGIPYVCIWCDSHNGAAPQQSEVQP